MVRKKAKKSAKVTQPAIAQPQAASQKRKPSSPSRKQTPEKSAGVVLLSGGNPQIAKADGAAPVKAYIAAMPGWKRDVGQRLDALIERNVPGVRKAVRWNSPFYGVAGQGWFLGFHCITKYVKVAFLNGTSLRPEPPVASKNRGTRYLHIYEDGEFDEEQVANWLRQAAKLPGEDCF